MPRRNPYLIPMLIIVVGIAIAGYYAQQWNETPPLSEADIYASTELNLAIELQQRGPNLQPQGPALDRLREQIRAEVVAESENERKKYQLRFFIGAAALIIGFGQMVFVYFAERAR